MRRGHEEPHGPHDRDGFDLIRRPREGVWWEARDGLRIRLAGTEHGDGSVERERLSIVAVLAALIVTGRARV